MTTNPDRRQKLQPSSAEAPPADLAGKWVVWDENEERPEWHFHAI